MLKFTEYVIKFLEKLDFEEKKSPHTLIAYSNDIVKAFSNVLPPDVIGPKISGDESYGFVVTEDSYPPVDADALSSQLSAHLRSLAPLEASSRSRKIAAFKKFFLFLKQEGFIDEVPHILVAPKQASKIPHFISVDEALAILRAFQNQPKNLPSTQKTHTIQLLFLLLYGAGLRVSEACNLKWESVNITRRELRILGKGDKTRVIAFPGLLQRALAQLRETQHEVYVWGPEPLNVRTAYNYIRLAGQWGGLSKPIHPHALRHSFATHLLNDGADLRVIQEMLGHASLNATEKYTHVSIAKLGETMETFHPLGKKVL